MGQPLKKESENKSELNKKIQDKFDLIFGKNEISDPGEELQFTSVSNEDNSMSESSKKSNTEQVNADLDLSFDMGDDNFEIDKLTAKSEEVEHKNTANKLSVVEDDSELEFAFDAAEEQSSNTTDKINSSNGLPVPSFESPKDEEDDFLTGVKADDFIVNEDKTQKTILLSAAQLKEIKNQDVEIESHIDDHEEVHDELHEKKDASNALEQELNIEQDPSDSFSLDELSNDKGTSEIMSSEEANANIEKTILDILKPKKIEATQEFDLSDVLSDDSELGGMNFDDVDEEIKVSDAFNFEPGPLKTPAVVNEISSKSKDEVEDEVDDFQMDSAHLVNEKTEPVIDMTFSNEELLDNSDNDFLIDEIPAVKTSSVQQVMPVAPTQMSTQERPSFISNDESIRVQATIRQLREEREELLGQLKLVKSENKELEQDNLTLKAAFDEAKIEISILRKRHSVEMEDIKYQLSLNEEKKALAEERAKNAEQKREKLEQKVRIDFNQVKQREKELESKLEMLSIDVDSQVHTRDQKILELRRKIDALEFNMENVSIKEQKSHEDKRRLEDKLNKIMKTLRHSIKNLEDDIDQASEEVQEGRREGNRQGKT